MKISIKHISDWWYRKTHRIVQCRVLVNILDYKIQWCPQHWFLFWHYKYRPTPSNIPKIVSYDTLEEATIMENTNIPIKDRLQYWNKHCIEKRKLKELENDF